MAFTTTIPTVQREENSTVADTAVINITSNEGYSYSASDFKITNATEQSTNKYVDGDLPVEIASVTFTDNDNGSVDATITFSGFPMDRDRDLNVAIASKNAETAYVTKNYACVKVRYLTSSDHTVTFQPRTATTSSSTSGSLTIQQAHANVYHSDVASKIGMQFPENHLANIIFTADSGKFYSKVPTPTIIAREYTDFYIVEAFNQTYNSNRQLTSISYTIKYLVPDEAVLKDEYTSSLATCVLDHFIDFNYKISTISTETSNVKIKSFMLDDRTVPSSGGSRYAVISGNKTAGCELNIVNETTGEWLLEDGTTTQIPTPIDIYFNVSQRVVLPFIIPKTTTNNEWNIWIQAKDGTTLESGVPTLTSQRTIFQAKPVRISVTTNSASSESKLTYPDTQYNTGLPGYSPFLRTRLALNLRVTPSADRTIRIDRQPYDGDVTKTFTANDRHGEYGIEYNTADIKIVDMTAYLEGKDLIITGSLEVKNYGYEDLQMQINLDNFTTVG